MATSTVVELSSIGSAVLEWVGAPSTSTLDPVTVVPEVNLLSSPPPLPSPTVIPTTTLAPSMVSTPALTTTFTPPSSCLTSYYSSNQYRVGPSANPSECYPSGWSAGSPIFYSPGLICPSGYRTSKTEEFAVEQGMEMRATCCPSDYPLTDDANSAARCLSFLPTSGNPASLTVMVSNIAGSTWLKTAVFVKGGIVEAEPIIIHWQSTDELSGTITSSSVKVPATTSEDAKTLSESLSTGGKAAIGVGVPVFILLCAVVGILLFQRKRNNAAGTEKPVEDDMHERKLNYTLSQEYKGELDAVGSNIHEMAVDLENLQELPVEENRHELPE